MHNDSTEDPPTRVTQAGLIGFPGPVGLVGHAFAPGHDNEVMLEPGIKEANGTEVDNVVEF